MASTPKVSVVIPTYKRPLFLKRAINSVLNQTYKNIEIIVVDDNHPEDQFRYETELLMESFNDNRVKYVKHKDNRNGAAARNTGIKIATGKYITFLDDDDEMLPNRIKLQVELFESLDESWGVCYTAYKKLKENGTIEFSNENRQGYLYVEALMRSIYIGSGSNIFARKKVVDEVGGYDESFKRNQDLEFLARLLERYKLAYIDEVTLIVHYEIREQRQKMNNNEIYKRLIQIDEFYLEKFRERINNLPKKDKKRVLSMIALERFRYSIKYNNGYDGFVNLLKNKVNFFTFIRYCFYILQRILSRSSFGFKI